MRILSLSFVFAFSAASFIGQQGGQNESADGQENYTLTVKVQLVVEPVVVKDKEGKPIRGLTAKDFVVTEDGVPQKITICEHQSLAEQAKPLPVSKPADEDLKLYRQLSRSQIKP
jgi:hypothetical protein